MKTRTLPSLLVSAAVSAAALAQTCPTCVPLTDLGPGLYQGQHQGGLYAGGQNSPPEPHRQAAFAQALQVVPRDESGAPSPSGWIGFISLGMSNTTQEFAPFERAEDATPDRNARVVIVNTAQSGVGADSMADPSHQFWTQIVGRVQAAGLSPQQVQVAWLKQAQANLTTTEFPQHALNLKANLVSILNKAREVFPNLRLCFVSSRIYGGYNASPGRWEPLSYETGFAYKWLIEDQIAGSPALNYGQAPGPVNAPLLLWGPYLWANGATPRSDGFVWLPEDYEPDFVHPSASGENKAAAMLSGFFGADPVAAVWRRPRPGAAIVALDATDDTWVWSADPDAPGGGSVELHLASGADTRRTYLRFDASPFVGRAVLRAKLSLRNLGGGGGTVIRAAPDDPWTEDNLTWAAQPPLGPVVRSLIAFSGGGSTAADITPTVAADADRMIALSLDASAGTNKRFVSKEGGAAPRLVLVLAPPPCPGDADGDGAVTFADITAVLANFGADYGPGGAGPGDANGDGAVGFADISTVLANMGLTCE